MKRLNWAVAACAVIVSILATNLVRSQATEPNRVPVIGTVKIADVLKAMINIDPLRQEREEAQTEISAKDAEFKKASADLWAQAAGLPRDSKEYKELFEKAQQLAADHKHWKAEAEANYSMLQGRQLMAARKELIVAVEEVAHRRGLEYVMVAHEMIESPDESFESAKAMVRVQVLLKSPDAADITDEVLEELKLSR